MDNQLFITAIKMAGDVIKQLKSDDMHKPTPCTEWDVRALVSHMVNETAWIKPLLAGKTIAEVGEALDGDLLGSDPAIAWQRFAQEAVDAVDATPPDATAHLSYADKPVGAYTNEVGADLLIHGWDLAQALGVEYTIDDATAARAIEATEDLMPMARAAGVFGPPVQVPADASAAEKLLADFGRSAHWQS